MYQYLVRSKHASSTVFVIDNSSISNKIECGNIGHIIDPENSLNNKKI